MDDVVVEVLARIGTRRLLHAGLQVEALVGRVGDAVGLRAAQDVVVVGAPVAERDRRVGIERLQLRNDLPV